MNFKRTSLLATLALAAAAFAGGADAAELPGHHPAYMHALTDLRDAHWNIEHRPGDAAVSKQETDALFEIDHAIQEATKAAAEDGKATWQHPQEDAKLDRPGRLHHALDLLNKAKQDVAQDEANPEARELRNRVVGHIDRAIYATGLAIRDVEQHR